MPDPQTYSGSCHCGKVQYDVKLQLGKVLSCNCSMCTRTGALLSFVPAEQFTLRSGEDTLSDYQFNKHIIHHHFCSQCGVRSFSRAKGPDGKPTVAINVRCLEGVDPRKLEISHYDGQSK